MACSADRHAADRGTPLVERAGGTLMPAARNRIRFIAIAICFQQIAVKYSHPRNRPLWLDRRVPTQNS